MQFVLENMFPSFCEVHGLRHEENGPSLVCALNYRCAGYAFASGAADASLLSIDPPEEPKAKRYIVDDVTYEKLGEVLADNPNGVLAYRDELISLLKTLGREEYVAARGFYLSAWSGKGGSVNRWPPCSKSSVSLERRFGSLSRALIEQASTG